MRVCPADQIQGGAGARWAFNDQGRTKAYVLDDNSLYGKGVATVFKNEFATLGGEMLGFESFEKSVDNYQTLMTSIADKGPDIVYVGATVENNPAKLLQDMRGVMGEEVIFLGSDGMNNQAFVDGAGDAANGAYITFGGYTPDKLLELGGPGGDYVTRVTEKPRPLAGCLFGLFVRDRGRRHPGDRPRGRQRPCHDSQGALWHRRVRQPPRIHLELHRERRYRQRDHRSLPGDRRLRSPSRKRSSKDATRAWAGRLPSPRSLPSCRRSPTDVRVNHPEKVIDGFQL